MFAVLYSTCFKRLLK